MKGSISSPSGKEAVQSKVVDSGIEIQPSAPRMLDSEETPLFPNLASGDGKGRDSRLRRKAQKSAIGFSN
jgi:hypothetical protein